MQKVFAGGPDRFQQVWVQKVSIEVCIWGDRALSSGDGDHCLGASIFHDSVALQHVCPFLVPGTDSRATGLLNAVSQSSSDQDTPKLAKALLKNGHWCMELQACSTICMSMPGAAGHTEGGCRVDKDATGYRRSRARGAPRLRP